MDKGNNLHLICQEHLIFPQQCVILPPPLEDEENNEEVEEEEGEADDEGDGDRELALDVQVGREGGEDAAFLPS